MIVNKELVVKGALGTAAVAATAGTTYLYKDQIFGSSRTETVVPASQEKKITKFDQGLIDFLGAGGDIKFKVLKSVAGSSDTNLQASDLTLSGSNVSVIVKVTVSTSGDNDILIENTGTPENVKGKKLTLRNLNKRTNDASGTDWTWTCEVKLIKAAGATQNELKEKDKLFKDAGNEGFFNKLKEVENKDLKKKFIENCAEAREDTKKEELKNLEKLEATSSAITTDNTLESSKEFNLRDKKDEDSEETENKLYFDDKAGFTKWFETTAVGN